MDKWTFVLKNKTYIKNVVYQMCNDNFLDKEDVLQQCMLDISEAFYKYDPNRGTEHSFIWWRIRLSIRNCKRHAMKNIASSLEKEIITYDNTDTIEQKIDMSILLDKIDKIDPKTKLCCISILEDWKKEKIQTELGFSRTTRDMRLYRLKNKLKGVNLQ